MNPAPPVTGYVILPPSGMPHLPGSVIVAADGVAPADGMGWREARSRHPMPTDCRVLSPPRKAVEPACQEQPGILPVQLLELLPVT